jgi:hypothetical protein
VAMAMRILWASMGKAMPHLHRKQCLDDIGHTAETDADNSHLPGLCSTEK